MDEPLIDEEKPLQLDVEVVAGLAAHQRRRMVGQGLCCGRVVLGVRDLAQFLDGHLAATAHSVEAAEALADFPHLTLLDAPIRRCKAFANATGQGMSVDELVPTDAKASADLASIMVKVSSFAYATTGNGG